MNLEFIRDLTGINRITDASSPNPNQSVGGSEIAVVATNNALRPIYAGYISIKERTALNIALRLQIVVKHSKQAYKGYYPVLGQTNLKLLSLGADVVDADYAIKVEARPNDEMKQVVRQAALEAMKPDRDGYVGMEMPDYLMIERLMDLGNLKLAQALLSERIRRNKEIQVLKKRENLEIDAKHRQADLRLKDEIEGRKQSRDFEGKKDLEDRKHGNKMEQLDKIHDHKIKEMQVEKAIEVTVDNLNNEQEGTTPKT